MMGQLPPQQNELFYDFCLDKHIPEDHLLRQIDQFLDFEPFKEHLKPHYSHTGRPSVDPELMIRMLLVGYCYGIRSERRLCEEVNFNLAYRWFCKLGLEDDIPEHSTFSKNRHGRFRDSDILRLVFDSVVHQCNDEGLIKGEGFAADASYIRADASKQRSSDKVLECASPEEDSRAVKEYLTALDTDPLAKRTQKKVSLTDPMSQWMGDKGPGQFYYCTNYLIDVEHNIIMDVAATPAHRISEVASTKAMLEQVEEKLDIKPQRLLADTAYGSAHMLGWLVEEKAIAPHIPVWERSNRTDGTFLVSDFKWDAKANEYRCPANKALLPRRRNFKNRGITITKANTIIYRSGEKECRSCHLKQQCIPNTTFRKIARSIHEDARDVARSIMLTDGYKQSIRDRKKVEVLFAHLKRVLRFDRLRLRGISGARDEFLLAATAQNPRKLVQQQYKPPDIKISAPP